MTLPELEKLSDAELSARVATEVMGWTLRSENSTHLFFQRTEYGTADVPKTPRDYDPYNGDWIPLDSESDAFEVIAKWDEAVLIRRVESGGSWRVQLAGNHHGDFTVTANTLPRSICLAALLAVQSPNHGFRHLREGVAK